MRRTFVLAVAVVLVGAVGRADAGWHPHKVHQAPNPTPGFVPGAAGRLSFAGVPGLGAPVATRVPTFSPIIGSEQRTGHFVHPTTGRTKYTGTEYNPVTGRFGTYNVRR